MIEIKYDDAKLKQLERTLAGIPRALPRVMSRALNRTATSARTQVARQLSQRTGLGVSAVRKQIKMSKASYSNWRSTILISSKRMPLIEFKAKQTRKGVTYRREGSRILIRHAFLTTMPSGHRGVFKRKTSARLPIAELKGPSLGHVFSEAQDEANRIYRESSQRLEKNIMDQVNLILQKRRSA